MAWKLISLYHAAAMFIAMRVKRFVLNVLRSLKARAGDPGDSKPSLFTNMATA